MSLNSSSSYSNSGSAVIQQGTLTFAAAGTATVPVPDIDANSVILLRVATVTARTNPDLGLDNQFTVAVTAGTGFTCVSLDALYAGTVRYAVFASSLPAVDIASV